MYPYVFPPFLQETSLATLLVMPLSQSATDTTIAASKATSSFMHSIPIELELHKIVGVIINIIVTHALSFNP